MIYDLNESNFLIFAAKAYDTPQTVQSEFESDLKRVKYIKRLIRRFKNTGEIKERLILNHIIILANVFGVEFATRMLFMKIAEKDYDVLKTFLLYLSYLPANNTIRTINGKTIHLTEILMNQTVIERLRKI